MEYSVGDVAANKYVVEGISGDGTLGKAYKVRDKITHDLYVMQTIVDKSSQRIFESEIKRLDNLTNAPNTLLYQNYLFETDGSLIFVARYMDAGSLYDYIRKNGKLDPQEATGIYLQIMRSIDYAHGIIPGIFHFGVRPQTILGRYDKDGSIEWSLSNWGIFKTINDSPQYNMSDTALPYIAPEFFKSGLCKASDIYSAGMVFYNMLKGRPTYTAKGMAEFAQYHQRKNTIVIEGFNGHIIEVIKGSLNPDPDRRPTIPAIFDMLGKIESDRASAEMEVMTQPMNVLKENIRNNLGSNLVAIVLIITGTLLVQYVVAPYLNLDVSLARGVFLFITLALLLQKNIGDYL